jgi:hypothetical protein
MSIGVILLIAMGLGALTVLPLTLRPQPLY